MKTNIILNGGALQHLKEMPDESINCVMTSPPYWALRDYGSTVEVIWDEVCLRCSKPFTKFKAKSCDCEDYLYCEHEWNKNTEVVRFSKDNWKQGNRIIQENELREYKTRGDSFCKKCQAWKGQLGLEPTFDLYIKHLCDIFDEIKRVLRKDGTCWINLGDTYGGSGKGAGTNPEDCKESVVIDRKYVPDTRQYVSKSLVMIPFRFTIEMVNRGWILRNTIIWHKPNCMPSSVEDRFTVDFEYIFFFVKNKKYWFETQYEDWTDKRVADIQRALDGHEGYNAKYGEGYNAPYRKFLGGQGIKGQPVGDPIRGRNRRTVWTITTQQFSEAHFAVYPEAICEIPIRSGCPEFVCNECGKAREKIIEDTGNLIGQGGYGSKTAVHIRVSPTPSLLTKKVKEKVKKGYTSCSCSAGFSSGIVLDPFFGAGTTGIVALKQNKQFIGIELNAEYTEIAKKRLKPLLEQTKLSF